MAASAIHLPLLVPGKEEDVGGTETKIKRAPIAVFEGRSPEMRALIAVGIGCDAHPGGVPGIGPKAMDDIVLKNDNSVERVRQCLAEHGKMDEKVIDAFVKALIYEPANLTTDFEGEYTYLFGAPTELPLYLSEFVSPSNRNGIIVDGPSLTECKGYGAGPHQFLSGEGISVCRDCSAFLCRFCRTAEAVVVHGPEQTKSTSYLCLQCDEHSLLFGNPGVNTQETFQTMKGELEAANFTDVASANAAEIEELHDAYVCQQGNTICSGEDLANSVMFPTISTSEVSNRVKIITSFDFRDGGRFIRQQEISHRNRKELVFLFAKLLEVGTAAPKLKGGAAKAVYDSVPGLLVDFAEGSRLDCAAKYAGASPDD
jgi:hypothetical protein